MRFSLKWVLAGVTYVAVAAAAFSQTTWVYADLLWAASLLAVAYAGLVTCFARGRRQMAAAGFVIASGCFVLCASQGDSSSVPTWRLLAAAGVGQTAVPKPVYPVYAPAAAPVVRTKPVNETVMTDKGPTTRTRWIQEVVATPPVPATLPAGPAIPQPLVPVAYPTPVVDYSIYTRAGNAVGTMLFGGVGILLGLAAYRVVGREVGASA